MAPAKSRIVACLINAFAFQEAHAALRRPLDFLHRRF
jgi:hypothetical protein